MEIILVSKLIISKNIFVQITTMLEKERERKYKRLFLLYIGMPSDISFNFLFINTPIIIKFHLQHSNLYRNDMILLFQSSRFFVLFLIFSIHLS